MKKLVKKGFTLIELLAIIIVLSGVFAFVAPQINKTITKRKTMEFEELSKSIENAARLYVSSHYDTEETPEYVLVSDLTSENFFDSPLIDPRKGVEVKPDALITIEKDLEGVFVYTFDDDNLLPSVITATMVSNNSLNKKYAKNGHSVTLEIQFNKTIINTPTVTIGGRTATVTGSGKLRTATYTIPVGEATLIQGLLPISITNFMDESNITGQEETTVTDGSVTYDRTPPVFTSFYIGGSGNPSIVKSRNTILYFSVTGASQVCISTTTSCSNWEAYSASKAYTLTTGDNLKTLNVWFRDAALNQIGYYSDSATLDTSAPTVTYFYIGGTGNPQYITSYNTTLYFFTINAAEMCISTTTSCTDWEEYAVNKDYTLSISDGIKIVYVWFRDIAGNSTLMQTDSVILDTVPPAVTYFYIGGTGNPAYVASTSTTLHFSASDTEEMCISTTASCSSWEAYSASKSYTLATGDGSKTINSWFKDAAGNVTTMQTDSIILDTTPPVVTYFYIGGAGNPTYILNENTILHFSVSGATEMCISTTTTCGTWEAYSASKAYALTAAEGTKTLYTWFRDAAGNTTPMQTDSVTLDTSVPVFTYFYIGGTGNPTYATSTSTTLYFSVSGVTEMCISTTTTCGTWEAYFASKSYTLSTGDATKTLYTWFRDAAGNTTSMQTDAIILDTTPPVFTYFYIGGSGNPAYISNENTILHFSVSGATEMCISTTTTCGTWEAYSTSKAYTLATGDATKTLYTWFRDAAGNTTPMQTDSITLDTVPPAVTYFYIGGTGNPAYVTNTNTTLYFSVSGVTEMCISTTTTCGTWEAYSATKAYTLATGEGTKTLYSWFRDIIGNTTSMQTDSITLDTVNPTITIATIVSNNVSNKQAKNGDTLTLSITFSESITNTPTVTIGGRTATLSGSGTTRTATYLIPVAEATLTEGALTINISGYSDAAGNAGSASTTITSGGAVTYDRTPPVYTAFYIGGSGNPAYILNVNTILHFSVSGATEMCISTTTTCGTWEAYSASKAYTLATGDGTKTLYTWYKDAAGNQIGSYSDTVTLDTTDPVFTYFYIGGSGNPAYVASTNTTLYFSVSGVAEMCISTTTTCGTWEAYSATKAYTLATGEGIKTLYTWFRDAAGNQIGYNSDAVTLDTVSPTITTATIVSDNVSNKLAKNGDTLTLSITFSESIANTPTVTIGGRSATLSGSGTTRTATYLIPVAEATLIEGALAINISGYSDAAGNAGSASTTITSGGTVTYDRTPPVYTAFYIGGSGNPTYTSSTSTTLYFSVSGATEMCISTTTTCGTWEAYAAGKAYTLTTGDGTKTLYTWYKDAAGNQIGHYSDTITLDESGPTVTYFYIGGTGNPAYATGTSTTLYFSVSEATEMCISTTTTCGTWEAYATSKAYTLATGEGVKTLYSWFRDAAGNVTSMQIDTITLDTTAPVFTYFYIGGIGNPSYTISTGTLLYFSVSGATEMCISTTTTCGTWEAYSTSKAYTLATGEGSKTLYSWYRDAAGNVTSMQTDSITLDTTAPVFTYFYIGGTGNPTYITSTSTTLYFSVSGATEMCISTTTTCGTWEAYVSNKAYTLATGEGSKTLYTWYRDAAGNQIGYNSDTVTLDTVDPVFTYFYIGGTGNPTYITNTNTILYFSVSGATEMCISTTTTCGTWEAYVSNKAYILSVAEGTKTLYTWYRDAAGNQIGYYSDTIILDTVDPVFTYFYIGGSGNPSYVTSTSTTLYFSVSGATEMCISTTTSCSAWEAYVSNKAYTLATGEGSKTLYTWFRDAAGHQIGSYSDTVTLDTTAPVFTYFYIGGTGNPTYATSTSTTLYFSVSGASEMCISTTTSCSAWEAYVSNKAYTLATGEGSKTLYTWYRDAAGNQIGYHSDTITLDTVDPVFTYFYIGGTGNPAYVTSTSTTLYFSVSGATEMCISTTTTCGTWEAYSASKAYTLATGDSLKTLYTWYRDAAGNQIGYNSDTVTLDTTDPVFTYFYIGGSGNPSYVTSTSTTLYFSVSGASEMCISTTTTCGTWEAYSASKAYTLATGEGSKTLYTWFRDAAGHQIGNYSDTVTLDTVYPVFTYFYIGGTGNPTYVTSTSTTLYFSVSGATEMCISTTTTCGTWEAYSATKAYALATGEGVKTLYTWYRDAAGNQIGYNSDTVTLDTTDPVFTYFYIGGSGNPSYVASTSTTLYFSVSGASEMCISTTTTCGTWEAYAASKAYTLAAGEGSKTLYTWFRDAAGHQIGNYSDTVTLDTVYPVFTYFYIGGTGNPASISNLSTSLYSSVTGVTQMCISTTTSCSAWEAYVASKAYTLAAGFGTKTLYAWYRDAAGNTTSMQTDSIQYVAEVHDTVYDVLTSGYSYEEIDYWMPRVGNRSTTIIQGFGTTYVYNYRGVMYFKESGGSDVNAFPAIKANNSTHSITRIVISVKARYNSSGVYLYVGRQCPTIDFASGPNYLLSGNFKPIALSGLIDSGAVDNDGYATWTIQDAAWITALLGVDSQCLFIRRDGNASVKNYWEGIGKYDSSGNLTGHAPTMTITWTSRT